MNYRVDKAFPYTPRKNVADIVKKYDVFNRVFKNREHAVYQQHKYLSTYYTNVIKDQELEDNYKAKAEEFETKYPELFL